MSAWVVFLLAALQLLDSVHALLRSGRSATQRDVYYNVSGGSLLSSRDGCNQLHGRATAFGIASAAAPVLLLQAYSCTLALGDFHAGFLSPAVPVHRHHVFTLTSFP